MLTMHEWMFSLIDAFALVTSSLVTDKTCGFFGYPYPNPNPAISWGSYMNFQTSTRLLWIFSKSYNPHRWIDRMTNTQGRERAPFRAKTKKIERLKYLPWATREQPWSCRSTWDDLPASSPSMRPPSSSGPWPELLQPRQTSSIFCWREKTAKTPGKLADKQQQPRTRTIMTLARLPALIKRTRGRRWGDLLEPLRPPSMANVFSAVCVSRVLFRPVFCLRSTMYRHKNYSVTGVNIFSAKCDSCHFALFFVYFSTAVKTSRTYSVSERIGPFTLNFLKMSAMSANYWYTER